MHDTALTSLRTYLRDRTASQHDRLDASVSADHMADPGKYGRFLAAQLRARNGIEDWVAQADLDADLRPPATADLLIADLRQLGSPACMTAPGFSMPEGADPLGLAWALAGSQMGNRAMLARLRKSGAGLPDRLPDRFLADRRMTAFWQALLPRLEQPAQPRAAQAAALAAQAVFAHFIAAFAERDEKAVAA